MNKSFSELNQLKLIKIAIWSTFTFSSIGYLTAHFWNKGISFTLTVILCALFFSVGIVYFIYLDAKKQYLKRKAFFQSFPIQNAELHLLNEKLLLAYTEIFFKTTRDTFKLSYLYDTAGLYGKTNTLRIQATIDRSEFEKKFPYGEQRNKGFEKYPSQNVTLDFWINQLVIRIDLNTFRGDIEEETSIFLNWLKENGIH